MRKKENIDPKVIMRAAVTLRVIAHPVRLRVIEALDKHGTMAVNDLMKVTGIGQAPLSKHLAVLRRKGIVRSKAVRNYRYYSIAKADVVNILNCLRHHGKSEGG